MQTFSPRDASHQNANASSQTEHVPLQFRAHLQNPPPPAPPPAPPPPAPQCRTLATFHTAFTQTPPQGKSNKWKVNAKQQQSMQQRHYPAQMQSVTPPHVYLNAYSDPRSQLVTSCDPYYYQTQAQSYFPNGYPSGTLHQANGFRSAVQASRPYVTITQFNYQPIGYHGSQAPNYVFPPQKRAGSEPLANYFSQASSHYDSNAPNPTQDEKSDSTSSFEFTIQPEQIVNSLCDDKDSEVAWPDCDVMNPLRIEDDELTKFIVEGCIKAEGIAIRNQHRPCFKNIKHLCNRTRTDILKPRTTVANIHSQGIPWATKDFIFAFVRLVNCWYILKGYLDDHDGSLGKIETTLSPDFKDCYRKWQSINKEMVKYLIDIFVSLDNGVTIQNAEIFSTFNKQARDKEVLSQTYLDKCKDLLKIDPKNLQSRSDIYLDAKTPPKDLELKHSISENHVNIPGILRVKDIFATKEPEAAAKVYMKPGSYRVPKKKAEADGDVWKSALESLGPFMESVLHDSDKQHCDDQADETDDVDGLGAGMCFWSKKKFGLAPATVDKFEKVVGALGNLQFAKYVTFEANVENVPDYHKYIPKPVFLCNIMNDLKQDKYSHPDEVVRDLRSIVRNSETYVEKRPDWWFERCLSQFSKELESQLSEHFGVPETRASPGS